MSDTSGPTFYAPLGKWDRDSQSWKTSEATSLWALTLSSLTLPTWGGLHDGELCELPTPELATSVLDCSSLPTPTRADYRTPPTNPGSRNSGNGIMPASEHSLPTRILGLLPTPKSAHGGAESVKQRPSGAKGSTNLEGSLLPTVNTMDGMEPRSDEALARAKQSGGCHNLKDVIPRIENLLPTPVASTQWDDATPEQFDEWRAKQKANHGNGNGHGNLLVVEANRLLPTPRAQEPGATTQGYGKTVLEAVTGRPQIGATTAPPSPDGNTSSDEPHQPQLSLDVQGIPA